MYHYENLKSSYQYKYNSNPPQSIINKNLFLRIIPIIINKQIITSIMLNKKWDVYYIASNYILISDGEWVAQYKISLTIPKYQQFSYENMNMNIYDSILNMDKYKLVKVGNKWCDLCVNTNVPKHYEIFGGIYCYSCVCHFIKLKNQWIDKYFLLKYLVISDVSHYIMNIMIHLYNLFY